MLRLFKVILMATFFLAGATAWAQVGVVKGSVIDVFGSLPGAKVNVKNAEVSKSTDVDGNYMIELPPGDYQFEASFVMYLTQQKEISVTPGDTVNLDFVMEQGFSIDQPVFIGARVKPRALLETTVPIHIISPQEIANSAQMGLGQILQYLLPSFHSTHQTISDGTDFIDPGTLRGLGPDQVLVLINGKRRHSSSLVNVNGTVGRGSVSTDLNAIPVSAVDRIEVLKDGAAAQYGSDAIAGVINVILKEYDGMTHIQNTVGGNIEGDGLSINSSSNFGFKIGEKGYINVAAEFSSRAATNRAGDYTGRVYSDDPVIDQQMIAENNFFERYGYGGRRVMSIGHSATEDLSLFFNADVPLSKVTSFYSHGGRNFRTGTSNGFYRFPNEPEKVVAEIYPDGFSPAVEAEITDQALTMGIRGIKNGWNLDFSNTIGSNQYDLSVDNSNNASLGVASPTQFYSGGFFYDQNITNVDVSRVLNKLEGINLGFGAELRIESYEIIAGDEASYVNGNDTLFLGNDTILRTPGAQLFPGFQPENELSKKRVNKAAYVDIEARVVENFILGIAGRYESYSDFGNQAIWKLSSRYKLTPDFSVSGGFSTGFRAPSLHQTFFSNVSTQFANGEALRVGTFSNESPLATALGIASLKPELSTHFSGGVAWKAGDAFTLLVDYYNIRIRDRIVLSGRFDEGYEAILNPLNIGAAQFFTNAIDSKTAGVDVRASYKQKLSDGNLFATLAGNYTRTNLDGGIKVPETLQGQEDVLFNREEVSRVEVAQPSFKLITSLSYVTNNLTLHVGNTYFGRVDYVHPDDGNPDNWVLNEFTDRVESRDQTFSPKAVTDISLTWQLNNHYRWTIGGNNVFDVYPDRHEHSANVGNGNFTFSRRVQQFGVRGAYIYARLLISL